MEGFADILNFAVNNAFAIFVCVWLLWEKKSSAEADALREEKQTQVLTELTTAVNSLNTLVNRYFEPKDGGGGSNV